MLSFLFMPALKFLTTELRCSLRGRSMSLSASSMAFGSSSLDIPLRLPTSSKCSGAVRSGNSRSAFKINNIKFV